MPVFVTSSEPPNDQGDFFQILAWEPSCEFEPEERLLGVKTFLGIL
jgi:hypothetical protein